MNFKPYNHNKNIMKEEWMGYIKIDPPLSAEEATYLHAYLTTFHLVQKDEELEGLYSVHSDREVYAQLPINNHSSHFVPIRKNVQSLVPSLVCPLVLGYVNDSKEVNALGYRASFKSSLQGAKWIDFLVQHFFKKDAFAKHIYKDAFLNFKEHTLDGEIIFSVNREHFPVKDFFNISVNKNITKLYNLGVPMVISRDIGNVNRNGIEYVHSCMKNKIPHLQALCYNITTNDIIEFLKKTNLHELLAKKNKFIRLSSYKKETQWEGTEEFYNLYDKYYLTHNIKKPTSEKKKIHKF